MSKLTTILLILFPFTVISQVYDKMDHDEGMVFVQGNDKIKGFYIDKYEVTVAEFREFVKKTNYVTVAEKEGGYRQYDPTGKTYKIVDGEDWRMRPTQIRFNITEDSLLNLMANYPISHMSAEDAQAYANWAGKRLPTLAEWKYAAKAGTKNEGFKYAGSNNARKVAWYTNNSKDQLNAVGLLEPNALGIYDMCGNVGELVYYRKNSARFIQKGGFFTGEKDYMEIDDDSIYNKLSSNDSWYGFGFRCVSDTEGE